MQHLHSEQMVCRLEGEYRGGATWSQNFRGICSKEIPAVKEKGEEEKS